MPLTAAHGYPIAPKGDRRRSGPENKKTGHTTALGRRDLVESLLSRLTPKEAEVIRSHDLEGNTFEAIAASWGSTLAAVRRFHSRVVEKLRGLGSEAEGGKD